MANVKINDAQLKIAKNAANQIERSIRSTYHECETLISFVQSAKWKGQSRDTFLTYLEIIQQYHHDLHEAVKLQTKALNNIEGYKQDFKNDPTVKEVRRL